MKWDNLEMFKFVDKMLYREEKQSEEEKHDCEHEFQIIEGHKTCVKCGIIDGIIFENDCDFTTQKPYKPYRPYEKFVYLRNLIRRINGYYFVDNGKEDLKAEEIPESLTKIRKLLKERKMNMKNDFYYWRIKYAITDVIKSNDVNIWLNDYKKSNIKQSPKKYLLTKMLAIDGYMNLFPLLGIKNARL